MEGLAGPHTASLHTTDENEPRGVRAYLIPPSPEDLYVGTEPKLTCLVVDLENKEGVTVEWTRESGRATNPDAWIPTTHDNTTVSIKSTLPVVAQDWIEGESYKCSLTHPDLPKAVVRFITRAQGEPQAGSSGQASPGSEKAHSGELSPLHRHTHEAQGVCVLTRRGQVRGGSTEPGHALPHLPGPELLPQGHLCSVASKWTENQQQPVQHDSPHQDQ